MSRNDDRSFGRSDETDPASRVGSDESERLQKPGAGAAVTGVHGVGAPDVTDHDVPPRAPDDDDPGLPTDGGAGS